MLQSSYDHPNSYLKIPPRQLPYHTLPLHSWNTEQSRVWTLSERDVAQVFMTTFRACPQICISYFLFLLLPSLPWLSQTPISFNFIFVEAIVFKSCRVKLLDKTEIQIYITVATWCVHVCGCMKSHCLHPVPNLLWLYYEWQKQQSILESYGSIYNINILSSCHHLSRLPNQFSLSKLNL